MSTGWVSWILSIVVLLLLFLTGYIMHNSVGLLLTGERAQGVVVGMDSTSISTGESEKVPKLSLLVEFVTKEGRKIRVSGRSWESKPTASIGDVVKVIYSKSNPKNAQFLLWREFPLMPAAVLLGFVILIIMMWIAGILITGDSSIDDPLHLLPGVISHFHMNPVRFPVLLILFFAIPTCIMGTYWTYKSSTDLLSKGIKVVGYVTGYERVYSKSNDGTRGSGVFPMIVYKDTSGTSHIIRRSLAKPLSRLKAGDSTEVIYLADKPDLGRVKTWDEFWPAPLFFGFCMIAFLVLFVLMISGYKSLVTETGDPEIHKELIKTGISAIATVIKVDLNKRYLHYRIDKDSGITYEKSVNFVSLEREFAFWIPPKTKTIIKKGDQFRAYLDPLNPFKHFYIDFTQNLGSDKLIRTNRS